MPWRKASLVAGGAVYDALIYGFTGNTPHLKLSDKGLFDGDAFKLVG